MNCEKAEILQMQYFDRELSITELNILDEHMKNCNTCFVKFDEMKEIFNALSEVSERTPAPPEDFERKVMAAVVRIDKKRIARNSILRKAIYGFAAVFSVLFILVLTGQIELKGVAAQWIENLKYLFYIDYIGYLRSYVSEFITGIFGGYIAAAYRIGYITIAEYSYIVASIVALLFAAHELIRYANGRVEKQEGRGVQQ